MGFYNDQDGIVNRYSREKEGWDKHLDNSKAFICDAIEKTNAQKIAVLGSGWLLDVPIEFLQSCPQVDLYDIRHPEQIKHKLREYKNFNFIETDLTNGLTEEVYQKVKATKSKNKPQLLPFHTKPYSFDETYDLVVSLNILNQLDILIVEFIRSNYDIAEEEVIDFRKAIQNQHILMLKDQTKSCLITDYQESERESEEKELIWEKQLVHIPFPEGETEKEWIWEFDHSGYYHDGKVVDFKVKALLF